MAYSEYFNQNVYMVEVRYFFTAPARDSMGRQQTKFASGPRRKAGGRIPS